MTSAFVFVTSFLSVRTVEYHASVYDAAPEEDRAEDLPLERLFLRWPQRSAGCVFICGAEDYPHADLVDQLRRGSRLPVVLASVNVSFTRHHDCPGGNFFLFSEDDHKSILSAVDLSLLSLSNFRAFKLVVFTRVDNLTLVDRLFTTLYSRGIRTPSVVSLEVGAGLSARSLASGLEEPRWVTLRTSSRSATIARAFDLTLGIRVGYMEMPPFFWFLAGKPRVFPPCTGYDCKIFHNLAQAAKATLVFKRATFGKLLPNATFTGDFRDLETGRTHVTGIPRVPFRRSPYFDYTYPHVRDNYCFMVRAAGTLPPEEILLRPFEATVKLAIFVFLMGLTGVLVLIRLATSGRPRTVAATVFDSSAVVFLAFISGLLETRTRRSSEMTLGAALLAFNIVVVTCYQSSLCSLYTSPRRLRDLTTLREVVRYSTTIYTPGDFQGFFAALRDEDADVEEMAAKFRYVWEAEDFASVREELREDRPVALMMYESVLQVIKRTPSFVGDDAGLQLHVVPECLVTPAFLSYAVSRRVSVAIFDALMARCEAAGLVGKWLRDSWYEMEVTGLVQHDRDPRRRRQPASPLRLRHFAPGFWALAGGFGVASVVFLLELVRGRRHLRSTMASTSEDITLPK